MRAAIRLFVRKGIDGTTIKDIAKEAGVAEGSLYRHFKSKDELAWYLFSTHLNRFATALMEQIYPLPSAEGRVRKFVEMSFEAYEEDPDLYSFLILREHSELEKFAKNYVHPGNVVKKIIEDGQASGEIRPGDLYVLGGIFLGAVVRLGSFRYYGNLAKPLTDYAPEVADAIWAMLRR